MDKCFQDSLIFPNTNGRVSQSAENLICSLLTECENRLDYDGIRAHAFFASVDFDNIRQSSVGCFVFVMQQMLSLM